MAAPKEVNMNGIFKGKLYPINWDAPLSEWSFPIDEKGKPIMVMNENTKNMELAFTNGTDEFHLSAKMSPLLLISKHAKSAIIGGSATKGYTATLRFAITSGKVQFA